MAYEINPGDLRTRITFQKPTIITDAGGAQSETYANVTPDPTVWAKWVNDHGQEALSTGAFTSAQRATITIRHRADVDTTWRITWGGETWKILSVDRVQHKNRYVEMIAERVTGTV